MNNSFPIHLLFLIVYLFTAACSQNTTKSALLVTADNSMPNGAWQRLYDQNGAEIKEVLLLIDGYYSLTAHESATGAFIMTKGGSFTKSGMNLHLKQEFHSAGAEERGAGEDWALQIKGEDLSTSTGNETASWKPLDVGRSTPLSGAWLFSGRERDGEMQRRDTDIPRKTMKLLTGTRFQWIAFNTETGEFFGTGGGEYTADGGVYVEKIRFFSRDNNRVGAELPFEFSTEAADWHHRGKSSAGEPMYEIWSKRTK